MHNDTILNDFQQILNYLLYAFLNSTSLTYLGVLLYPLINNIARYGKFKNSVITLRELSHKCNFAVVEQLCTEYIKQKKTLDLAKIICEGYKVLDLSLKNGNREFIINSPDFFSENDQKNVLIQRINKMNNYIKSSMHNDLLIMVIHESFAYGDYVPGYSDCDTFAIVKKEVFNSPARLIKLRKKMIRVSAFFFSIDPFQHHGVLLCSEVDLKSYPLNFLPQSMISNGSTIVSSHSKIKGFENVDTGIVLIAIKKRIKILKSMLDRENDLYDMKNIFQNITMLPVEYYELTDLKGVGKKEALERFRIEFPALWPVIDSISEVRITWQDKRNVPSGLLTAAFHINHELIRFVYRFCNTKTDNWILDILGSNWRNNFLNFLKSIENLIEKIES